MVTEFKNAVQIIPISDIKIHFIGHKKRDYFYAFLVMQFYDYSQQWRRDSFQPIW